MALEIPSLVPKENKFSLADSLGIIKKLYGSRTKKGVG